MNIKWMSFELFEIIYKIHPKKYEKFCFIDWEKRLINVTNLSPVERAFKCLTP